VHQLDRRARCGEPRSSATTYFPKDVDAKSCFHNGDLRSLSHTIPTTAGKNLTSARSPLATVIVNAGDEDCQRISARFYELLDGDSPAGLTKVGRL